MERRVEYLRYPGRESSRDARYDLSWTEIDVEIDAPFHRFALTPGFWDELAPELFDGVNSGA